jgi:hypothetical protein
MVLFSIAGSIQFARGQEITPEQQPTGKALEVISSGPSKPALIALSAKSNGFWSDFPRFTDWKLPPGEERVQAVSVYAKLVGEKAEVSVSVFRGKRFGETKDQIASFVLAEGESAKVSELARFGIEPCLIRMIRVEPSIANVPLIVNPVASLVAVVVPIVSTLPTFRLRLTNNSEKAILAMVWHTEARGKRLMSSLPQGKLGRALIGPNAEYQLTVDYDNPDPTAVNMSFIIEAVIYEDGSFEGDSAAASHFLEFVEGRKKALSEILPILRSEANTAAPDLAALITRIDAAGEARSSRKTREDIAFSGVLSDVLAALRALGAASPQATGTDGVRQALLGLTTAYSEWFDRLPK